MLTDDELKALKDANPGANLRAYAHEDIRDGYDFVYKVPEDGAWKQFQTHRNNDEMAPYALRTLVIPHMVRPSPIEFTAMLKETPGLVETIGNKMVRAAGATNAGNDRKL